jgi:tRNA dimethylallyltransferase
MGLLMDFSQLPKTIAIVGPTAVGKTAVAVELAHRIGKIAEIVSVDSMQVYRHMDIGTAKPSPEELHAVRFHMIDTALPSEEQTLAVFQAQARAAIEEIHGRGGIAILAGGTGLYFRSITTNLDIPHTPPDQDFRDMWTESAAQDGGTALRTRLLEADPVAAEKIHPGDIRRMIRALEVLEKTGTPLSEWHRRNREADEIASVDQAFFCLNRNRAALYEAIERRVDLMMADGFLNEVASLRERGYSPTLKPMQALGYRQLNEHLDGLCSLEEAVLKIKSETRQFARRQLIWFRADKRLQWLDAEGRGACSIAEEALTSLKKIN